MRNIPLFTPSLWFCYFTRSLCVTGAAEEVGVEGHQPHAQQPRGRDLPACAEQQPLHTGGPALHQRGLWRSSDRLQNHGTFVVRSSQRSCGWLLTFILLQDFGEFMRENRLTPVSESSYDPSGKLPSERAKAQLERYTRYWPMIISQTTIFNMQAVSSRVCYCSLLFLTSACRSKHFWTNLSPFISL